ncbi:type IV secretory system conjugative DNA transfer family protein [Rapidithrix thailandica]|uniref:Type IV secretory system conjugative DNA transfer family protein n=1 Tax=Rapidithrix thailandica TaxID=413964 RepID=A0AAW9SDF3_9BACT
MKPQTLSSTDATLLAVVLLSGFLLLDYLYWAYPDYLIYRIHHERLLEILETLILRWAVWVRVLTWMLIPLLTYSPSRIQRTKAKPLSLFTLLPIYILSGLCWINLEWLFPQWAGFLYPALLLTAVMSGSILPSVIRLYSRQSKPLPGDRKKIDTSWGFHLPTKRGYINLSNPQRGILVIGAPGSGKSYSVVTPILHQAVAKGYTGLVYDFKFPSLAEELHQALFARKQYHPYFILNFKDVRYSHRVNPLAPQNLPTIAYAEEYSKALLYNLYPSSQRQMGFFELSASAWLTAIIWYYRQKYPHYCTLPHVINTALYEDFHQVLEKLEEEPQAADMARSITTAVKTKADKQLAGVIASLQVLLARINSPEIAWVLTGKDFDLDLNSPQAPKLLCIGSDPTLTEVFSPVISCIITVALKLMNQPGKLPSMVLVDEASTLYLPKLEVVPATGRSNRIATILAAQDFHQLSDAYGREKAQVLVANLNNQFFGKINSLETARYASELIGKEEVLVESRSVGRNTGSRHRQENVSFHFQEKSQVRPQDLARLKTGEFIGQTVETPEPFFWADIQVKGYQPPCPVPPFQEFEGALDQILQANFLKVKQQVEEVMKM